MEVPGDECRIKSSFRGAKAGYMLPLPEWYLIYRFKRHRIAAIFTKKLDVKFESNIRSTLPTQTSHVTKDM